MGSCSQEHKGKEESVPAHRMEEEEVEGTGLCTQSGSRQAAWVPATGRHSKFRSQLRVNAESKIYYTLQELVSVLGLKRRTKLE